MIKIKLWRDLAEVEENGFKIFHYCSDDTLEIYRVDNGCYISDFVASEMPEEDTLNWLKLFGFEVEVEESKIISEQLYHVAKAFPYEYFACDKTGELFMYGFKPYRCSANGDWGLDEDKYSVEYHCEHPFKWEDEPVSSKDIIAMYERQEEE